MAFLSSLPSPSPSPSQPIRLISRRSSSTCRQAERFRPGCLCLDPTANQAHWRPLLLHLWDLCTLTRLSPLSCCQHLMPAACHLATYSGTGMVCSQWPSKYSRPTAPAPGLRHTAAALCWLTPGGGLSNLSLIVLTAQQPPHCTMTSPADHSCANLPLHLSLFKSQVKQQEDPCPFTQATLYSCVLHIAADPVAG